MTELSYSAHVLDNGLTVLLREDHSAPIISHWIWYRVGSRNEVPGKTGISHFVEHMHFKGTKRFPGLTAEREISRRGGLQNGFTCFDWTSFYQTMPTGRIGIAIETEADRMRNSVFDPKEVESERTVILSEMEGGGDRSIRRLMRSMQKAVFPEHPYGRDVTGETEDLCALTRDDLFEHYQKWYVPNNAVVAAAGDFETDEMLRMIEAAYGAIPAFPVPVTDITCEKPICAPVRIEENRPGGNSDLRIEWLVPGAKSPDIPALTLLLNILAGPNALNTFDGVSLSNRSSRLYRKLVNSGLTADINSDYLPTIDPCGLTLSAEVSEGISAEDVSEVIFSEIETIAQQGVPAAEIETARKRSRALFAYSAEVIENQAFWLGYSSMFAGPDWPSGYLKGLENVTTEDISRIARTLFRRENCVTGVTIP